MKRLRGFLVLALLSGCGFAQAETMRPFVPGSAAEIRASHAGRPYILALWSISCAHCADELALLGQMKEEYPALNLVLVSTDTPDDRATLTSKLAQYRLANSEQWVFADAFVERLRFELDPRWQGELPRRYLVGRDGSVRAVSGKLAALELRRWLKLQQP
ncbi:MAG: redoxin domain-containing protein [Gammaproteobacteria bacterium]|nr:redoxin domain-containing protein [Gammaproteobacteria bacterium]